MKEELCESCSLPIKELKVCFIEGVGMVCKKCFDKDYYQFLEQEARMGRSVIGEQDCEVEIKKPLFD